MVDWWFCLLNGCFYQINVTNSISPIQNTSRKSTQYLLSVIGRALVGFGTVPRQLNAPEWWWPTSSSSSLLISEPVSSSFFHGTAILGLLNSRPMPLIVIAIVNSQQAFWFGAKNSLPNRQFGITLTVQAPLGKGPYIWDQNGSHQIASFCCT